MQDEPSAERPSAQLNLPLHLMRAPRQLNLKLALNLAALPLLLLRLRHPWLGQKRGWIHSRGKLHPRPQLHLQPLHHGHWKSADEVTCHQPSVQPLQRHQGPVAV